MKMSWRDYLNENALLRVLCRLRAAVARKRTNAHWLWSVAKNLENPDVAIADATKGFLPGRRQWIRLPRKIRASFGETRTVEETIYRTARKLLAQKEDGDGRNGEWQKNFLGLVGDVQALAGSSVLRFHKPTLHLIPKKGGSLRCLASFDELAERLLISRAAVYLRDVFDSCLSRTCYAFRANGDFNYKTAIDDLVRYRMQYEGKKLYVAECDIQSFFDTVNHDVAIAAYDSFVNGLETTQKPPEQLRKIIEAYLAVYTSRGNLMTAEDERIAERRNLVKPLEETGVGAFYPGKSLDEVALGIPQGGALSPLIANLVLSYADRAVESEKDDELFYCRFCDDIIIIHPNRKKCGMAMKRYLEALTELKLPVHKVKSRFSSYGAKYYETKSKGPFLWASQDDAKSAMPWVAFLGVHVKYDGQVRVRHDSIDNHVSNLQKELSTFMRAVGRNGRLLKTEKEIESQGRDRRKEEVFKHFQARLVSIGTGYSTINDRKRGSLCWMAAFPSLTPEGHAAHQMRRLDSMRGKIFSSLKKFLGLEFTKSSEGRRKGFYGRPYSYYGALIDVERHKSYPPDMDAYSRW